MRERYPSIEDALLAVYLRRCAEARLNIIVELVNVLVYILVAAVALSFEFFAVSYGALEGTTLDNLQMATS